jgi:hypothetical protein
LVAADSDWDDRAPDAVTTVASRSDAQGSGEAPGWHSHTGAAVAAPDVVTVELDGWVVAAVSLGAVLFRPELHPATNNATPATVTERRQAALILELRHARVTIYHGCQGRDTPPSPRTPQERGHTGLRFGCRNTAAARVETG